MRMSELTNVMCVMFCSWNEWVTLPIRFSDLPKTAQLCITIYDCGGPSKIIPVGGTTITFFGKNGVLRQVSFEFIRKICDY